MTWTGQRDIPHHRMSYPVHKLEELRRRAVDYSWDWPGITWRVAVMHHFFAWLFASESFSSFFSLCVPIFIIAFSSITTVLSLVQLLNSSYVNPQVLYFFLISLPIPLTWGESEWMTMWRWIAAVNPQQLGQSSFCDPVQQYIGWG